MTAVSSGVRVERFASAIGTRKSMVRVDIYERLLLCTQTTGLIGSTEYVEENMYLLTANQVAYINMDVAVSGNMTLGKVIKETL